MAEETFSLDGNLPESEYSGLSELPEVKTPMEWLRGNGKGEFREQLLDEVIPQRQELPDWSRNLEEQDLPAVIEKKIFYDGTGQGMNKIGEFFYTVKDSFARGIENMPLDVMRFLAAIGAATGIEEESNTDLLKRLDDVRTSQDFAKALRDFELGVDADAFSNEIADVFGQMGIIILGGGILKGAGVGVKTAGGVLEGLAEGGEYLSKDIAAQRQHEGGLEQYKGEGLGFATGYGVIAGLMGARGVEASFLDHFGEFTGKKFLREAVEKEMFEEGGQNIAERLARRTQNEIYGTDTDKTTWLEDLLSTGKAMLLGGIGGATVGGVAFVNNHNRMKEILVDNFGLTKTDANKLAWQYLEDSTNALVKNSMALQDLSPKSRVMQFSKEQLMRDGQTEKEADKTLARIRRDIIKEQVKKDEELSKNEFFERSQDTNDLVEYLREKTGVQVMEDSVIEEEKQNIADRRAELESQLAQTETQAEETAQEQPTVETQMAETVPEQTKSEQQNNLKQSQFDIIQSNNPMHDDYHVGIRSIDDIKTFDETINDEESFVWGDYSREDAQRDLAKGTVTVYSSHPIEQGGFVSTSRNQARDYAGGKNAKIYQQEVPITDVAWISGDEGQLARVETKIEPIATEETTSTQPVVDETTSTEQAVTEKKPTEQPKETPTPVQLELNFLNAQENAINQAMGIESPTLPVNEDMLTKQDIDTINNKIDEINTKLDELKNVKTDDQKAEYEVGKELNSFQQPKQAKSIYAERIAKQTKTEGISPILHNVRDTKAAKKAVDDLVENEENVAWEMLENNRADTRGFLRAEVAEALKRKIAKTQDPEVRKTQLRRLISAYSDVATRAGQELRALADDSLVDAIRDAAQIESEASRKVKRAVKNKADKVQKTVDKIVKSNKVMSDKKLWDMIKEKMECK